MMAESLQLTFDYGSLDPDTRVYVSERAARIHRVARLTAQGIVEIGECLAEVKTRLGHGHFVAWIRYEFAWSERSARRFIEVFERFKSANLADLEIDVSALYLIAAPRVPEPIRAELMRRARSGEKITHRKVQAALIPPVPAVALPTNEPSKKVLDLQGSKLVTNQNRARQRDLDTFRGLYDAVEFIANFHESAWDTWQGLTRVYGDRTFPEHLDRAITCLTRLRKETSHGAKKPQILPTRK